MRGWKITTKGRLFKGLVLRAATEFSKSVPSKPCVCDEEGREARRKRWLSSSLSSTESGKRIERVPLKSVSRIERGKLIRKIISRIRR